MVLLSSEQFSTHFGICCVVTRSTVKPTDANKRESRQKSHKMLSFLLRLRISGPVIWLTLSKNNLLDMDCSSDSTL